MPHLSDDETVAEMGSGWTYITVSCTVTVCVVTMESSSPEIIMLYMVPELELAELAAEEHPDMANKPIAKPRVSMQVLNLSPALRHRLFQPNSKRAAPIVP